jgi:hypothetical protein
MERQRLVNSRILRIAAAVVVVTLTLTFVSLLVRRVASPSPSGSAPLYSTGLLRAPHVACADRSDDVLAYLAQIRAGHSASELGAQGDGAVPAIVPSEAELRRSGGSVPAEPAVGMVVVRSGALPGSAVDVVALQANPAVQSVGALTSRSSNPLYRSCDNQLADSPGAQALLRVAEPALLGAGIVTQEQLDAPSTIFYVSDDPFDSAHEYVTVVLASAISSADLAAGKNPPVSSVLTPVVASVDVRTNHVSSVGFANWYAGE